MNFTQKTAADLGWSTILAALATRARSAEGAARALALTPLNSVDEIRVRLEEVTEARALSDAGDALPLGGIHVLADPLARSQKAGALDADSLRQIASTLEAGAAVRRHLASRRARAPRLCGRAALIADLDDLSGAIVDTFEDDGKIADSASPALAGLRRRAAAAREELDRRMTTLLDADHVAPHLQDHFFTQRDDRYVVPIRADARSRVRGIVHGLSQSGQTFFVEPEEVVELNNRLKLAELEVYEEEQRILAELTHAVAEAVPQIRANVEILGHLDLVDASATLSVDLRATPPEVAEDGARIDLRRARHPLMLLAKSTCVPNDILLERGQTLVISGPNAGGKTVALKIAGLLSLMATHGLHIPAQEGSTVPLWLQLFTDIGDDQSLENDLSTFSAHILHLRDFLAEADARTLVLLDELAVGTDPDQGAALAQAFLEALAARGATAIVTTHYDRLKALAATDAHFANASVGFDFSTLQPTFELQLGVPGASGAFEVAERLGLPASVTARSKAILEGGQAELEALLTTLASDRRKLADEVARAEDARRIAEESKTHATALVERARERAHDDAVASLTEARAALDKTRTVLRRQAAAPTRATLAELRAEVDAQAAKIREHEPAAAAPPGRVATPEELISGARVWVTSLAKEADVLAPVKGGKLTVQAGPLKMNVAVADVRLVDAPKPKQKTRRETRGHNAFDDSVTGAAMPTRGGYPTLDVRGERADVALGLAEKFLDDALRSGQERLLIVHGHGTGKLRDLLRAELTRFPGVSAIRAADPKEGGDGVTVIELA